METRLGKIRKAEFGWGSYNDIMLGLTVDLGGESWGVGDHKGATGVPHTEFCKWTDAERRTSLGDAVMWLGDLLTKAKVRSVSELVGKPVEVTFEGNLLKSWRILEEVL